ncbi:GMC oxidoreductase [Mycobacterium gordonae]|uniref:Cholesterol oxidase n=1 Tax=Mycobacterium gordonae TaxID=1778 RepID=A0A1X1VMB3_MYCGO|nr:GMC family oxidoreductase [Mycobacterium gordonae]MCV7007524.1 GMC family oxidoreductase [Mycobacterium gordonae]ODR24011.1 cholesterol oxidase [Mycobacterium gordonae]ORV70230.1 cholesterol oxidase [Mycobacterium gordonae]
MEAVDYDVVVIGSGFGGSVSALRLTEKGYRVGVLEAGRRFEDAQFPKNSLDLRNFLWAPKLGCTGIQRIHVLPDVIVLAGAGVGGGSLNYANTLYEPKSDAFYRDRQWAHITDWRDELAPYYDQAKRMLGVVRNPTMTASDVALRKVAEDLGVGDTFGMTPVGVYFGPDNKPKPGVEVDDPFFGGAGPRRRGCIEVGECMTGCRHNAKNTLMKNYLYLAERAGAKVHDLTTVVRVRPLADGGYAVDTVRSGSWWSRRTAGTITAQQVIFAAGTWGTQQLLHRMKADGTLSGISDRLGVLTRTNSEALCGASVRMRQGRDAGFHHGVAITSSIHPDDKTHIEPVRYGKGPQSMGMLTTVMTDGGGRAPRWLRWLGQVLRHPGQAASVYAGLRTWSQRTVIALVMQTEDNSLTLFPKRRRFGGVKLSSRQGHGVPNPTWIPKANEAVRQLAEDIGGMPYSSVGEIFDIPMTAHFLGGCTIGDSPQTGVIDPYHRVYGHPGLHVVDGSAISANIGVNPSLTITAQAERAMSFWPNVNEEDARPGLGAAYQRLVPVAPQRPVVPGDAPAALRLPVVER